MRSIRENTTQTTCDCEDCTSYALTAHLRRSDDQAALHHQALAQDGWTDVEGRDYCPGCPTGQSVAGHDHTGAWVATEA
ncbi:hypothetical protein [Streptomyces zaomyceticus]|uniref:hypothetical protein n=1 Tax=Streptomyces zaomyceticus TaxID=68286 RepID=UPI003795480E